MALQLLCWRLQEVLLGFSFRFPLAIVRRILKRSCCYLQPVTKRNFREIDSNRPRLIFITSWLKSATDAIIFARSLERNVEGSLEDGTASRGLIFYFIEEWREGESKIRPRRKLETVEKRVSRINSRLPADSIDGRFPSRRDSQRWRPKLTLLSSKVDRDVSPWHITGAKNDSRRKEFTFSRAQLESRTKRRNYILRQIYKRQTKELIEALISHARKQFSLIRRWS